MNLDIGLRTLALLAFVAAATVAIVKPELLLGAQAAPAPALKAVLVLGHA